LRPMTEPDPTRRPADGVAAPFAAAPRLKPRSPGAPPGIEHLEAIRRAPEIGDIGFEVIDFEGDACESRSYDSIDALLEAPDQRPSNRRWIDVKGLHPYVLSRLKERFSLHTLAAEDVLSVPQRPKVEAYDDDLFVVVRMLRLDDEDQRLVDEQISLFLLDGCLLTIQEAPGDVWESVRKRLRKKTSRFRQHGLPYLFYALLDAIIDHAFPMLDAYYRRIDAIEQAVVQNPAPKLQTDVHAVKRELVYLRQALWPMRDVAAALYRDEFERFSPEVETYLRDVYDHAVQAIDAVEMYRETAASLQDLLIAAAGNRMNEVMKALTIMASLFLPLTFLAGVYGMNFEHLPELSWKYAYPTFWGVSACVVVGLLAYFKRKGWIGK